MTIFFWGYRTDDLLLGKWCGEDKRDDDVEDDDDDVVKEINFRVIIAPSRTIRRMGS